MTIDDLFNELAVSAPEQKAQNTKYVKMTYTKNGTIVLSPTNNKSDSVDLRELDKFMKAV